MNISDRIRQWNIDRGLLDNGFDPKLESRLLTEELEEFNDAKAWDEQVDAICDLMVISIGSLWKMGIDPDKAMEEVLREIESRSGKLDENGKFQKILTGEEYKADYSKCVLR